MKGISGRDEIRLARVAADGILAEAKLRWRRIHTLCDAQERVLDGAPAEAGICGRPAHVHETDPELCPQCGRRSRDHAGLI